MVCLLLVWNDLSLVFDWISLILLPCVKICYNIIRVGNGMEVYHEILGFHGISDPLILRKRGQGPTPPDRVLFYKIVLFFLGIGLWSALQPCSNSRGDFP